MQRAEELKKKGNTYFLEGDSDEALRLYGESIEAVHASGGESIDGASEFLSLVYSNMSNVYLTMGRYDESWQSAEQAIRFDPKFIKSWFRYIQARRLAGYPFEAFVALLRYLRPLLSQQQQQSQEQSLKSNEFAVQLEEPLYHALGLSRVSPHIELQDYEGGVGIITRKAMKANDVIFVEKRFQTSFAEMDLGIQHDLTTTKIVEFFAKKILSDQQTQSPRWIRFNKEFKGCWPRSANDISSETRSSIAQSLRDTLPEMSDAAFDELLFFAITCRYNCFHSGFFRACALANHSCLANAAMKYNEAEATVTLICVRPIEAGEFVNVKYLSDAHFLMGVGRRREHLRSWLFWCGCERCHADCSVSATSEQLRCHACHAFTHLPLPGDFVHSKECDPMLPLEKPCLHCGERVGWNDETRATISHLTSSLHEVIANDTYAQLLKWLNLKLSLVARFQLHPTHWMYRLVFYFFCVPLTGIVSRHFEAFVGCGWNGSHVEELLRDEEVRRLYSCSPTTPAQDEPHSNTSVPNVQSGGDALYCLSVLWHLIASFYPQAEGWALHRAICQLVLFAMTHPDEVAAMPIAVGMAVLKRHGRHLGNRDASLWIRTYSQHKPTATNRLYIRTKQLKAIFQV